MHSRTAATTAVAVFITGVALRTCGRGVLLVLVLLSLSGVAARRVGDLMLDVRLAAVNPWFVHADSELAGPRERRAAAAPVVVLIQGVKVVAVIVLVGMGCFDQRVDHNHQQD